MRIPPRAIVLIAAAAAPLCVCSAGEFTVAVYNLAGVPSSVIAPAIDTARRAFAAGGIDSHWVVCDADACPSELSTTPHLELFIMPRLRSALPAANADRRLVRREANRTAGYAMPDGFAHPRAYAFYDAATIVADQTTRPLSTVLGCILLHELGHLLGLSHRASGIMRDNLQAIDMDQAVMGRAFSAFDAARLRAHR